MRSRLLSLSIFLLVVCGSELFAADAAARFVNDVLPLLEVKFVSCHAPEKQEGDLHLVGGRGESGWGSLPLESFNPLRHAVRSATARGRRFSQPDWRMLSDFVRHQGSTERSDVRVCRMRGLVSSMKPLQSRERYLARGNLSTVRDSDDLPVVDL